MRAFFLLLVLANLGFYAYAFVVRLPDSAESQIPLLQISPEKIKLIGGAGGAAGAEKTRRPAAPANAASAGALAVCVEWGVLAGADVARADAALAGLDLPQVLVQRAITNAGGYWVYIPPAKTKAEVDKRIGELNASGVTEFFVVQDATPWRNAISLGIFKSEDAARSFLEALRGKGVRTAVAERREKFLKQIAYFVREPSDATVAKLAELQREFPGTQIKAVACPPVAQPQG